MVLRVLKLRKSPSGDFNRPEHISQFRKRTPLLQSAPDIQLHELYSMLQIDKILYTCATRQLIASIFFLHLEIPVTWMGHRKNATRSRPVHPAEQTFGASPLCHRGVSPGHTLSRAMDMHGVIPFHLGAGKHRLLRRASALGKSLGTFNVIISKIGFSPIVPT